MDNLLKSLKYVLVGNPEEDKWVPTVNAQTNDFSVTNMGGGPNMMDRLKLAIAGKANPYEPKTITPTPTKPTTPPDLSGWKPSQPVSVEQAAKMAPSPTPMMKGGYPIPTPPPKVSDKENLDQKVNDYLTNTVFPITRKYNIPDALAASQWAVEGGRVYENPQNNLFGLLKDNQLIQYPSIERNVDDYALTVTNILKNKGYDINKLQDAFEIIKALQDPEGVQLAPGITKTPRYEAHTDNPYKYVQTIINTPEWRYFYK